MTLIESEDGGEDSFLKQFDPGKWPDDNDENSAWLYSCNASSPSSCLSYGVEDCEGSLQSISENPELLPNKAAFLFDGSRVSPVEETLIALNGNLSKNETIVQEDLEGGETLTWMITPIRNDFSDSSTCSNLSDSFLSMSLEDSSTSDDSSSQFSIDLDSPCLSRDDRTGFSLSLINLNGQDSDWFSDTQSEIDLIHSDFPSPSYKKSWGFNFHSSGSSVSTAINMKKPKSKSTKSCFDENLDAFDLADFSPDTPLFWPTNEKSDWSSDVTLDFLMMSPPKYEHKLLHSTGSSHGSFRFRVHQGRKMEMGKDSRRRLVFGSGSKSSNSFEFNCRNGQREVRRRSTMPLTFIKSRKCPAKTPLQRKADSLLKKSAGLSKEDFILSLEVTVETMVGLKEFDGHEGIESEFNKDDFSLDEDL
ncbi:hypothetical protein DCAR_0520198 [Daucus carota subsp. sativus]|uniref:Uncharacterized protein n=2 Tax=Daucus carota subsp. sativus TaxID=79200 RepID=A0A164YE02_DAUCS|nr:hypothetical protein DCAR_0520198 [Daucus carota subsp. sativus]